MTSLIEEQVRPAEKADGPWRNDFRIRTQKSSHKGHTILLVDDHKEVLDVGAKMLRALGYGVLTAQSGEQAVKFFQECKDMINVVILDMNMPGMGGGEVYDKITDLDPDVLTILVSGSSLDEDLEMSLETGKSRFLKKPFDLKTLSRKLNELINEGK
jgi:CheY-like chemotaxis protein